MYQRKSSGYLAPPLAKRELQHRRVLLIGIGALIVLGTSPVFGHHLATRADTVLAGRDHIFNICLIALHEMLAPVHLLFHVLLAGGLTYALFSRFRAVRALRMTLSALPSEELAENHPFGAVARTLGLRRESLRIVRNLPTPAFTAGWVRPRVFIAHEVRELLTTEEVTALLAHETAHVRRHDPLKLSLLRFLADTLFYIPALRTLADDVADEAEIAADDFAAGCDGTSPAALAFAILKLSTWEGFGRDHHGLAPVAVGFQRSDLLERRVRRLIGDDTPVASHVTRRSLSGAVGALVLIWVSGVIMAHPMPAAVVPNSQHATTSQHFPRMAHCRHAGGEPWSHVFCLGLHHAAGTPCPHTGR